MHYYVHLQLQRNSNLDFTLSSNVGASSDESSRALSFTDMFILQCTIKQDVMCALFVIFLSSFKFTIKCTFQCRMRSTIRLTILYKLCINDYAPSCESLLKLLSASFGALSSVSSGATFDCFVKWIINCSIKFIFSFTFWELFATLLCSSIQIIDCTLKCSMIYINTCIIFSAGIALYTCVK